MKEKTILVVDDDEVVRDVLKRILQKPDRRLLFASDGDEALRLIQETIPDLVLLDIRMPSLSGPDVLLKIRSDVRTQMVPVVFLTGQGDVRDRVTGLNQGADDYITKPFEQEELTARVEGLLRRSLRQMSANPLTHLPGGPAIEEEVSRKLEGKTPFAFFYVDIDHFKAFNDHYGYDEGDRVIRDTAELLLTCLKNHSPRDGFAGHIGGDDFVLLADVGSADRLARDLTELFDRRSPSYYNETDRERGCVTTKDRRGILRTFPLMALSVAIVTTEQRRLEHYGKVVDIAAEIKQYLKTRPDGGHSVYLKDRRKDD